MDSRAVLARDPWRFERGAGRSDPRPGATPARFLHVTGSWVYEHTRDDAEDRLPFVKLGKYVRFDRTDLREYVDAKRHAARTGARRC